jgi:SAM-dependent methyltransferase
MMPHDPRLRSTFDEVAQLYDQARPGYPEALIQDAVSLSGIPPGGRILEIGCGPGKATLPFAHRGYSMLCLELGPALTALAAEHCRPYPAVEVQAISFEDWPLQPAAFDLVLSAEAFHWIPPEIGYTKAAQALKEGGALALCWNGHLAGDEDFLQQVESLYGDIAPSLAPSAREAPEVLEQRTLADFQAASQFGDVVVRRYPWAITYTADQYVDLLRTYSPIQALPEGTRRQLLAGIRALIEERGGAMESRYSSVLYVGRIAR